MSATASLAQAPSRSSVLRYAVDFGIADDPATEVAVEVFWPEGTMLPIALFCLPGGAMNRQFYNLDGGEDRFSFAAQMTARGLVCILVDLPGTGDSDRPVDGYELTPKRITHILQQTYTQVCDDIKTGAISPDLPPLPQLQTVGLGHSMGAMFSILQQAEYAPHAALAVLGFATHGLPQFLSSEAQKVAKDTDAVRAQMVPLAKKMFPEAYAHLGSSGNSEMFGSTHANREAVQALKAAREPLLAVPAFMSMLPGNVAPEAAQIRVPVFAAYGALDFVKQPSQTNQENAGFEQSPAVEQLTLPDTGHSFFLFESRSFLFDRLAQWACGLISS